MKKAMMLAVIVCSLNVVDQVTAAIYIIFNIAYIPAVFA